MDFGTFTYPRRKSALAASEYLTDHNLTGEWYLHRNMHQNASSEEKWVLDVCFEKTPSQKQLESLTKGGKFLGFDGTEKDAKGKGDED